MDFAIGFVGGVVIVAAWVGYATYRQARKAGADRLGAIKDAGRVVIRGGGGTLPPRPQ